MSQAPNIGLSKQAQLTDLADSLRHLLTIARQGEWDQVTNYCDQLLPILAAVEKTGFSPETGSLPGRNDIQETIALMQSAIEKCSERKAQIAPLINALAPAKPD